MMRKTLFMIQVSSLFHSTNEKNLIGENNMVTKQKNPTGSKNTIKRPIRKKNENKIVVIIGTIIIILLVVLYWSNDQINKKKRKKEEQEKAKQQQQEQQEQEKAKQQQQEQEDFEFLKSLENTDLNNSNLEKIVGIFEKYKNKNLYIFFLTENNKFTFGIFFCMIPPKISFHEVGSWQLGVANIRISLPILGLIVKVLDFKKFEQKYRNKIITEEIIKEYVDSPENQRN